MTDPVHDLFHARRRLALRHARSVNHNDLQTKHASGFKFGRCSSASGVFGNDMCDAATAQQCEITLSCEWSAREHDLSLRKRQWCRWRVNKAQQIEMVRLRGEGTEALLADGKKNPCRGIWQRCNSGVDIAHMVPIVICQGKPVRALIGDKRRGRPGTRLNGVSANLGGTRMRRVDHMRDPLALQISDEPVDAAKATHPRWYRLRNRHGGATGIGEGPFHTRLCKSERDMTGFRSTAQKQDAHHD